MIFRTKPPKQLPEVFANMERLSIQEYLVRKVYRTPRIRQREVFRVVGKVESIGRAATRLPRESEEELQQSDRVRRASETRVGHILYLDKGGMYHLESYSLAGQSG